VSFLIVVGGLALFAVLIALRRNERRSREQRAATVELEVDAEGVRRTLADGREEAVRWDEVTEVEVITTKVGVHRHDGVLLVLGADEERGCLVPSALATEHGVIERVSALPGFDVRALVGAMEQSPPSRTTVWVRSDQ
jgi:hypothetical protein